MKLARKKALFWLFLFFVLSLGRDEVRATTPAEHIKETLQQVLSVVRDTSNGSEEERKTMLKSLLTPRFDWVEMAKQTLGKHWNQLPSRRHEFIATFTEFLGNSYIGQISSYKDEKILFVQESVEKNLAQVDTQIVPTDGEPTSINYRLHLVEGEWKIYDVVIEDISIVRNYRSQFSRILAKGSIDDLLMRLREKNSKK